MGPINVMPVDQSVGGAFGEGFGKGMNAGLSAQLQDMLEQKQAQRQMDINRQLNKSGPLGIDSPLPPSELIRQLVYQKEYLPQSGRPGAVAGLEALKAGSYGQPSAPQGGINDIFRQDQRPKTAYEDMPALEEGALDQYYQPQQAMTQQAAPSRPKSIQDYVNESDQTKALLRKQVDDYNSGVGLTYQAKEEQWLKDKLAEEDRSLNTKINAIKGVEKQKEGERAAEKATTEKEKPARDYIDSTIEKLKKSREKNSDLQSIIDLSKGEGNEGKIISALDRYLAGGKGLLFKPKLETIEKLSNDLVPSIVQKYTGQGKILKAEAEAMIKSIPNLLQTETGRVRVAKYMLAHSRLDQLEYDAIKKTQDQYESEGKSLDNRFKQKVFDSMDEEYKDVLEEMHQIAITDPNLPPDKVRVRMGKKTGLINKLDLNEAIKDGAEQLW